MNRTRRSGRIAKELPIVLLGTDTLGKVFSEETHTVVLSRHGAGIASRYKVAPDEVLTLRLPDSAKEAEVRLVGQIGGEPGHYIYGLAFADPDLEFWPMEFPPPEPDERPGEKLPFECSLCGRRQKFAQRGIEEDVYAVNGFVLRFCPDCGTTTRWKKAEGEPVGAAASFPVGSHDGDGTPNRIRTTLATTSFDSVPARSSMPLEATLLVAPTSELIVPLSDLPQPAASKSSVSSSISSGPAAAPQEAPPPAFGSSGRRINRRRHVRVKVNFRACVRHPAYGDEVVECENVSKGGVCFQSHRQYSVGSSVEIAAPYASGEPALFSPAKIVRADPIPGGQVFRYGAAYLK
ncbi:MAG TPA: PilZ domain-containing protein [Candidatus Methylomirabilis sp.]|nr:PilZ domain-containing protein [Candidatus Methylomirabilis sp.]